jgi:hypothetical protein
MRKFILTTVFICSILATTFAQVGIGTIAPNASSVLDLTSTTKAFLPPRMTTVQRNQIANPVAGMTIFNTTTTCIEFYNGTGWYNVCTGTTSTSTAPTITSVSPTPVTVGGTLTINGTNFTSPATVNFSGVGTAATATVISATQITVIVPAGATTGTVTVITNGGTSGTAAITVSGTAFTIDGFSSSNQVASTNLIAYWPFDTNQNEAKSGLAPNGTSGGNAVSGGTATITASSRIGAGALQLTNGWLTYPLGATPVGVENNPYNSTDTLTNGFTMSLWAQLPVQTNYNGLFQLSAISNEGTWPLAGFGFHKNTGVTYPKIDIDGGITNSDGTSPYTHSSAATAFSNSATNGSGFVTDSLSWVFLTMVYDTTSGGKIVYYGNGAFIGSVSVAVGAGASSIFPAKESLLLQTPNYASIGTITSTTAFPTATGTGAVPAWASGTLTGVVDDIRFFNKTLTAQQVNDLFQLGSHGQ